MANAGSALMGIGRASGENRAIEAAQQAISSPLLEVSIDGARGILFNVIGGLDMSMHEINTVAETITTAADPEANIIFGATINPELEGEIIVTVVATGFDESYYSSRDSQTAKLFRQAAADERLSEEKTVVDEAAMQDIDMDLEKVDKQAEAQADFHSEDTPNIWALSDSEQEGDNDKKDQTSTEANELDKPSFLRRFKRRPSHDELKEGAEGDSGQAGEAGSDKAKDKN